MPLDIRGLTQHIQQYRAEMAKGPEGAMEAERIKQEIVSIPIIRLEDVHELIVQAIRECQTNEEEEIIIQLLKNDFKKVKNDPNYICELRNFADMYFYNFQQGEKQNFYVRFYNVFPELKFFLFGNYDNARYSQIFAIPGLWDADSLDSLYLYSEESDKPHMVKYLIDNNKVSNKAIVLAKARRELQKTDMDPDRISTYVNAGGDVKSLFQQALHFNRVATMNTILMSHHEFANQEALMQKIMEFGISKQRLKYDPDELAALQVLIDSGIKLDVPFSSENSCIDGETVLSLTIKRLAENELNKFKEYDDNRPLIKQNRETIEKLLKSNSINVTVPNHQPFKTAFKSHFFDIANLIYDKSEPKPTLTLEDIQEFLQWAMSHYDGVKINGDTIYTLLQLAIKCTDSAKLLPVIYDQIIKLNTSEKILRLFVPNSVPLADLFNRVTNAEPLIELVDLASTDADFEAFAILFKRFDKPENALLLFDLKVPTQTIKEILNRLTVEEQNKIIDNVILKLSSKIRYVDLEDRLFKRLKTLNFPKEQLEEIYTNALSKSQSECITPLNEFDRKLFDYIEYRAKIQKLFDQYQPQSEKAKNTVEAMAELAVNSPIKDTIHSALDDALPVLAALFGHRSNSYPNVDSATSSTDSVKEEEGRFSFDLKKYLDKGIDVPALVKAAIKHKRSSVLEDLLTLHGDKLNDNTKQQILSYALTIDKSDLLKGYISQQYSLNQEFTAGEHKGKTPFEVALILKRSNHIQALLNSSKDLNLNHVFTVAAGEIQGSTIPEHQETALSYSIKQKNENLAKQLVALPEIDVSVKDNEPFKAAIKEGFIDVANKIYDRSDPKPTIAESEIADFARFALFYDTYEYLKLGIKVTDAKGLFNLVRNQINLSHIKNIEQILRLFIPTSVSVSEYVPAASWDKSKDSRFKPLLKLVDVAATEDDFKSYARLFKYFSDEEDALSLFDAKVPTQTIKEIFKHLSLDEQNKIIVNVISKLSSENKYDDLENVLFKKLKDLNLPEEQVVAIYLSVFMKKPKKANEQIAPTPPQAVSSNVIDPLAKMTSLFDQYHPLSAKVKNTAQAIQALKQSAHSGKKPRAITGMVNFRNDVDIARLVVNNQTLVFSDGNLFSNIVINDSLRFTAYDPVNGTFTYEYTVPQNSEIDEINFPARAFYSSGESTRVSIVINLTGVGNNARDEIEEISDFKLEDYLDKDIDLSLLTKAAIEFDNRPFIKELLNSHVDKLNVSAKQNIFEYALKSDTTTLLSICLRQHLLLVNDQFLINGVMESALSYCVKNQKFDMALILLNQPGIHLYVPDADSAKKYLSRAIKKRDLNALTYLYAVGHWPINDTDVLNLTKWGNVEAIELCVNKGGFDRNKLYIISAQEGQWDYLFEEDALKFTPTPAVAQKLLLIAIEQGNYKYVEWFLTYVEPSSEALIKAATSSNPNCKIVEALLECGANPATNNYSLPLDAFNKYCETQDTYYLDIAKLILLNLHQGNEEAKNKIEVYFTQILVSRMDNDVIRIDIINFIKEALTPSQAYVFDYLQMQAERTRRRGDETETAMEHALTKRATLYFENTVKPAVRDQFDKVSGNTAIEKVATIEREIKGFILDEIISNCKMTKADDVPSQQMFAFINVNRQALIDGKDQNILKQMIAMTSNNDIAHLAWRAYDPNVNRDTVWEPLLCDRGSDASNDVRTRVAMYYLGKPDTHSFIGQLASMERVLEHSYTNETTDSFSCYPGCIGRISRMGEASGNFLQLPPSRQEKILDFIEKHIYKHYEENLNKLNEDEQEILFYSLTGLTPNTALDIMNDRTEQRFPKEWLKARQDFIAQLGTVEEIKNKINALFAKEGEVPLSPSEAFYLSCELNDIGGSGRNASLIAAYEKMAPKEELPAEIKKPVTVANPYRFSFADKNLPTTHTANKIRKYIEFEMLYSAMESFLSKKDVSTDTMVEWLRTFINEAAPKAGDTQDPKTKFQTEFDSFLQSDVQLTSLTPQEQSQLKDLMVKASFSNGITKDKAKDISVKLATETKDEALAKKLNLALEKVCPEIKITPAGVAKDEAKIEDVEDRTVATNSRVTPKSN